MKETTSDTSEIETLHNPDVCSKNEFSLLGIEDELTQLLTENQFTKPTSIQEQAIPHALLGKDIIGIAQTGTGKTFAFLLPMIQKLQKNDEKALILVPTRELAWQVEEAFRSITGKLKEPLSAMTIIGGVPIRRQLDRLKRKPRVIIATPGRLEDHLRRKSLNLTSCKTVILDEADRMFDVGFAPQIKKIFNFIPKQRQILLFSATMPKEVLGLINDNLTDPVEVQVTRQGSSVERIFQELCIVDAGSKNAILKELLSTTDGQAIVFARTKHGTKKLARSVEKMGYASAELHSNRSMGQRKKALDGFRSGKYKVLVATDIAARGIDISDIELVVNYDLPQAAEDYVHRIGRTGRAGKAGRAISLAMVAQTKDILKIEKLTTIEFTLSELSLPFDRAAKHAEKAKPRPGRNSRSRLRGPRKSPSKGNSKGRSSRNKRRAY